MQKLLFFMLFAATLVGCGKGEDAPENTVKISGRVRCVAQKGLGGAVLTVDGASGFSQVVMTGADGSFEFSGLPAGQNLTITASKAGDYFSGVTSDDLPSAQVNAVISPFQILALLTDLKASATQPNEAEKTVQRLINNDATGLTTPVWRFAPADLSISNDHFSAPISTFEFQDLTADVVDFEIVGVKFCDVNGDFCQ